MSSNGRLAVIKLLLIFLAQSILLHREADSMRLLSSDIVQKRFLYYSNGNCETFEIRCFSQRDCQAYGPRHQCVLLRCAVSCRLLPADRGGAR